MSHFREEATEGQKRSLAKVITSVSWCAIDFPDTTTRSRESSNIASSICGERGSDPNGGVEVVGVRQAKLGMDY